MYYDVFPDFMMGYVSGFPIFLDLLTLALFGPIIAVTEWTDGDPVFIAFGTLLYCGFMYILYRTVLLNAVTNAFHSGVARARRSSTAA